MALDASAAQRSLLERAWYALPPVPDGPDAAHPAAGVRDAARGVLNRTPPAMALLPPIVTALLHVECPAQQQRVLRQLLAEIGFDGLAVARALPAEGALQPQFVGAAPEAAAWVSHYDEERLHRIDPCMRTLAMSALPCLWDADALADVAGQAFGDAAAQRWRSALGVHGVRSGLWFCVRAGAAAQPMLVTMTSHRGGRGWISDGVVGQAWLLAVFAAEHPPAAVGAAEGLSTTQQQILHCVAQGMSDKLIADALQMTTHNVDYHLRRLRQHFGVRNRVQLVRAALGQ